MKAFDLYLLIDTTKTYNQKQNAYCIQYKSMSDTSPSSCFDLMMDYAIEIVKAIASFIGYYSNDLSNGLRVQASLIKCVGSQKDSVSVSLFALTGDSTIIMNGLNNARINTALTETASCYYKDCMILFKRLRMNGQVQIIDHTRQSSYSQMDK